jgi:hypothetical protein
MGYDDHSIYLYRRGLAAVRGGLHVVFLSVRALLKRGARKGD